MDGIKKGANIAPFFSSEKVSLLDPRPKNTQLTQEKSMKQLILIFSLLFSMECYSDDVVDNIIKMNNKLTVEEANQIYEIEKKYADKYDIPVEVGLSITAKESTFKKNAKSSSSYGLKQINYGVWSEELNISKKCLTSVECNIKHGYIILRHYVDMYDGNLRAALMAYRGSENKSTNRKYARDIFRMSDLFS